MMQSLRQGAETNARRIGRLLMAAVCVLFMCNAAASAQVLYGSITGTVTDKSGALLPNASLTISNQGTNDVRTAKTNGQGAFNVLDMLPGTYSLSIAQAGGLAGYQQKDIQIEVNRQVRIDITLQAATVATSVTVTEAPPTLQTESGEVNAEISQTEIAELPITSTQGRSYQALYSLIPGGAAVGEQNSTASNPSRAMSVNVNGTEYNGNTTRIDGAVNYYGWLPYLIAYVPPADSIENVSITTSSFNAEQGQAGGASIKITTKSGTRNFHGSAWEYYQDALFNARAYTSTQASLVSITDPNGSVPKNVFDQFGFNIGGPVYLPKILTGKKKLFFFDNFERTTRRQLITGTQTVPDTNMINGNFSEATSVATLYDPQPGGVVQTGPNTANGYLLPAFRPTFTTEYGETGSNINTIPTSRIAFASSTMIANLAPIAQSIGTPSAALVSSTMANDYVGSGTLAYNRNTNDAKITYVPTENTQVFGKYSIEPFSVADPQELKAAGGGTFDGGQPGAAAGRIQNVGMGVSHVFTSNLVLDVDAGYTRQVTGAQSAIDIADGDYGLNVLKIPGTNGAGLNYVGQPVFSFNSTFSTIGNSNTANPFLFRDNQFTTDVNLSWTKGRHATKYGFTYYHFDLNHFQPTSGGGVSNVRGGFLFQGGMTCGGTCGVTGYNALADFLLGLPNNGTGNAIQKAQQVFDPNAMRWSEFGAYAQDQWTFNQKLTIDYGVRYEVYPTPYRDHTGISLLIPTLPQTANVEIGGVNGNPENAGENSGHGFWAPRLGMAYRLDARTVVRMGTGLTVDPDSMRYLRDSFPWDLDPNYSGTGTGTIAVDPANTANYSTGQPMPLTYGIPVPVAPNYSNGFASLPISGSTTTIPKNYRRGYLESWNLFVQRDLGHNFVANVGWVGNHFVRQPAGVSWYNAAPLPSGTTPCMANGQYNPSTGLTGACSFQDNTIFSQTFCGGTSNCYNSGGVNVSGPIFSSMYEGMQSQLTHNTGKNGSFGVVYTWSHAFDYDDNGAGSGSGGTIFNYPAYYRLNKADASYDRKDNLQVWSIYKLPFGYGQALANNGVLAQIVGGFQLNGQFSHISGAPFSVSSNSNVVGNLAPGFGATYAELLGPYIQQRGHNRTFGNSAVSGGRPWFDPGAFASVVEPTYTATQTPATIAIPVLPNTGRNEFRGPGQSVFNASIFRAFHVFRESEFQVRVEAFNVFNHALLTNPNATVPTAANMAAGTYGTFGLITSFGSTRTVQFGGRLSF
jgi:Carboxypeptidase regulatory-like domain